MNHLGWRQERPVELRLENTWNSVWFGQWPGPEKPSSPLPEVWVVKSVQALTPGLRKGPQRLSGEPQSPLAHTPPRWDWPKMKALHWVWKNKDQQCVKREQSNCWGARVSFMTDAIRYKENEILSQQQKLCLKMAKGPPELRPPGWEPSLYG